MDHIRFPAPTMTTPRVCSIARFAALYLVFGLLLLGANGSLALGKQGFPIGQNLEGTRISWHPNDALIARVLGSTVLIEDATLGTILNTLTGFAHPIISVSWSLDGTYLAVGEPFLISVFTGAVSGSTTQQVSSIPLTTQDTDSGISSLSWDSSHRILATAFPRVFVWNGVTGERTRTFSPDPMSLVSGAIAPDNGVVVTGDLVGRVVTWELATNYGRFAEVFDRSAVFAVDWNPTSDRVAAGSSTGLVNTYALEPVMNYGINWEDEQKTISQ